jgi:hypothetical protein
MPSVLSQARARRSSAPLVQGFGRMMVKPVPALQPVLILGGNCVALH